MLVPAWERVRLPLPAWALVLGARWIQGARRGEAPITAARERAAEAAEWLGSLAGSDRSVLAVTHATARSLIADALETRGWVRADGSWHGVRRYLPQRYAHWSAWALVRAS